MNESVHQEDFFIVHDALVLMTSKETIAWMIENTYFHLWLIPMNGLKDGTPDDGFTVGNITVLITLDNSLNRDILHTLHFNCVFSHFVLDWEGINKEERIMQFSFSMTKEITRGIKHAWESKMGKILQQG